jgi:hypothetical protein
MTDATWFTAYGKVTYDPYRGRMQRGTQWWCVIELEDHVIADYYRWMVDRFWWMADTSSVKRTIVKSPHTPHISLIRGERPRKNEHLWGSFMAGQRVQFRYSNQIIQTRKRGPEATDRFWFVDVQWDPYHDIRQTFGLPVQYDGKPYRPHLTVAQTHDLT